MTNSFLNILIKSAIFIAAVFCGAKSALGAETNVQGITIQQLSQVKKSDNLGQVTSVSQFSDVQPTDWAFQALQSLVERYSCIAGYPNGTFRSHRALSRYEFAAGLNACLDRINELITTGTSDLVTQQDLATLQRLQQEFSAELATLRGRVDALEIHTSQLEANQFSTTTRLSGEVLFNVSNLFGDKKVGNTDLKSNTDFSDRIRLSLYSSFTGKDQLQIRLQARNVLANNGISGTHMTRLSFDGDEQNDLLIDKINYAFNLSDTVRVKVDVNNAELYNNTFIFSPDLGSDSKGSISRYGRSNPIYRQGAGGAGFTVEIKPKNSLTLTAAYLVPKANNPTNGNGLFDGSNTAFGQVAFQASKALNIGLSYAHTYQNTASGINLFGSTGSNLANQPFGKVATVSNHYTVETTFQPSKKLTLAAWTGYTNATAEAGVNKGKNADAFYWATLLSLKDFGRDGNLLGIIFGQPPKITNNDIKANQDKDTSYHLEGIYQVKINDHIILTPGLLVIFNPEHNNNNSTQYVGTLRTTFTF